MVLREVILAFCIPCVGRIRARVGGRSGNVGNIVPSHPAASASRRNGAPAGRKGKAEGEKEVFVIRELDESPGVVRRRWARIIGNYEKRQAAEASARAAAEAAAASASKTEATHSAEGLALPELPGSVTDAGPRGSDGGRVRSSCDDVRLGRGSRPASNISRGSWKSMCSCKHGGTQGSCIMCRLDSNESRPASASSDRSWETLSTSSCRDVGSNGIARKSCVLCRVRSADSVCNAIRASTIWDRDDIYCCKDDKLFGRLGSAHSSCIYCDVQSSESRRSGALSACSCEESFCSCCDGDYYGSFESSCSSSEGGSSSERSASAGSKCSVTNDRKNACAKRRFSFARKSNRVADARCTEIKKSCIVTAL